MHRGYIKLWRKSLDTQTRDRKLWTLWTHLLLSAAHKETDVFIGQEKVHLLPGQIVTGRKALAKKLSMSVQNTRTRINTLKINHQITTKATNRYTIITIVNWDTYQGGHGKLTNKQPADQPMANQQLTTNKNVKNVKNTNNNPKMGQSNDQKTGKLETIDGLCQQVDNLCLENGNRFSAKKWAMFCMGKKIHPSAIVDGLESVIKHYDSIDDLWAWCDQIVKVQAGNYNEADSAGESDQHKNQLQQLVDQIGILP